MSKINNSSIYFTDEIEPESYSLKNQLAENLEFRLAKDKITATKEDNYKALALSIKDRMVKRWLRTQQQYIQNNVKKVHYLSMEFLMGRLLGNALINLGFYDECKTILSENGYDLEDIREVEHDMGLGNGGLGRLAACFLDSMATLQLPAFGYGIRYEYGIFEQDIDNGWQIEHPDNWLNVGSPWEVMRPEHTYKIKFFGKVQSRVDSHNKLQIEWVDTNDVEALAYDIPIPGYGNQTVNNLRLWEAKATHDFDFSFFNQGDYIRAVENKNDSENISKVLYPNDNSVAGKELRLKQQYFFVSASLQDIIRKHKISNVNLLNFHEKNVIQLNDTHPAIAIPELMRLLLDEHHLPWDTAWKITQNTFAYTNHTVLSEALEKWSVPLFERLLPRHLQIIYEINYRFLDSVRKYYHNDLEKVREMSIIMESGDRLIRMANLAIVGSKSVNGVAALHTKIIKENNFKYFNEYFPEKFNNKTNGITQRRWLLKSNRELSSLIEEKIGSGWITDLYQLKGIEKYAEDAKFLKQWQEVKQIKKNQLIDYLEANYLIKLNPNSIFDVQIKRMHEYKRQLLNILNVIRMYNFIKRNPDAPFTPRTFLFGGKAAPGYYMAKLTIKLINSVGDVINNDPAIGDKLKVLFIKNYSVSLAEKIIPAADLSEQISTAGYEASGTGNMKFMLNGALTIGTLDGANIEMMEEMGKENIFIFGLKAEEVVSIRKDGYNPFWYYQNNPEIREIVEMLSTNYFSPVEQDIFQPIIDELLYKGDKFCLMADFEAYTKTQDEVSLLFNNKKEWFKKSILNVANSGKFSSDRTIKEYADDIWHIVPEQINSKPLTMDQIKYKKIN